ELPLGARQPRLELGATLHVRIDDDACFDGALRPRTPRRQDPLEGALARRDQVDVRNLAAPLVPRAVALVARRNPPPPVHAQQPLVRPPLLARSAESRADRGAEA